MESFNKIHDCCGSDVSNGIFGRIVRKCIQEITSIENHLSFGLAIAVALCIFTFLKWLQRWFDFDFVFNFYYKCYCCCYFCLVCHLRLQNLFSLLWSLCKYFNANNVIRFTIIMIFLLKFTTKQRKTIYIIRLKNVIQIRCFWILLRK